MSEADKRIKVSPLRQIAASVQQTFCDGFLFGLANAAVRFASEIYSRRFGWHLTAHLQPLMTEDEYLHNDLAQAVNRHGLDQR